MSIAEPDCHRRREIELIYEDRCRIAELDSPLSLTHLMKDQANCGGTPQEEEENRAEYHANMLSGGREEWNRKGSGIQVGEADDGNGSAVCRGTGREGNRTPTEKRTSQAVEVVECSRGGGRGGLIVCGTGRRRRRPRNVNRLSGVTGDRGTLHCDGFFAPCESVGDPAGKGRPIGGKPMGRHW